MDYQAPPAPPPLQPAGPGNSPYGFITESPQPGKKGFGAGGSKMQRIIVVGAIAAILLVVGLIFASVLGNAGSGAKADYQSLVEQQAEIIRVSEIGVEKARSSSAKNLAVTTKLSLTSSQSAINSIAKSGGAKTDAKTLALGKDGDTDKALTTAEQTNRFDETFIQKLNQLLSEYQKTLKRLHDQTTKASSKTTLEEAYKNAGLLMQNGKP